MVEENPPGCWLHQMANFQANFLPKGSVGRETDVFPFPHPTNGFGSAMLGGGDMVGAYADRPEVREVVRFILSPEYGVEWARRGGFLSANRRFDVENYPPFWRDLAGLLDAAFAADALRFDGSDLMPLEVQLSFDEAMLEYLAEGPASLDGVLAELDAAWLAGGLTPRFSDA
jgi:alpha-glucoside transport system substrate-binding protein